GRRSPALTNNRRTRPRHAPQRRHSCAGLHRELSTRLNNGGLAIVCAFLLKKAGAATRENLASFRYHSSSAAADGESAFLSPVGSEHASVLACGEIWRRKRREPVFSFCAGSADLFPGER